MKMKTETKRQAILDVAAEAFGELGFGVSMSEITARVGGSKATIYNYFSSKEELFCEVILRASEAEFEAVHNSIDLTKEDMHESLCHFGERFLAFLYSPEIRAHRHLAISESGRTELGRLIYERGVVRSQNLMAEFLSEAMKLGKLRQSDPLVATRHLVSLLESELLDCFLFQLPQGAGPERIKAVTARAIDVFMAAYGRQPESA